MTKLLIGVAIVAAFRFFWLADSARHEAPFSHGQWRLLGFSAITAAGAVGWWGRR
jgi:hypothetical protein